MRIIFHTSPDTTPMLNDFNVTDAIELLIELLILAVMLKYAALKLKNCTLEGNSRQMTPFSKD